MHLPACAGNDLALRVSTDLHQEFATGSGTGSLQMLE